MAAGGREGKLDEWPVWYWTALEAAADLRYGALMCADDAKNAYLLSEFAACTGELFFSALCNIWAALPTLMQMHL